DASRRSTADRPRNGREQSAARVRARQRRERPLLSKTADRASAHRVVAGRASLQRRLRSTRCFDRKELAGRHRKVTSIDLRVAIVARASRSWKENAAKESVLHMDG